MNQAQITSFARQVLLAGGGFVVGKGWVDQETFLAIVGAVSVLIGSAWAIYSRRTNGLLQEASKSDRVLKIVTDAETAFAVPSDKVVPPAGA